MAWSWSHTDGAYINARENLNNLDREKLEVIFAEWKGKQAKWDNLHKHKYEKALVKAKTLPDDVLADFIWDKMEEQALCTNGGHEAHCCPFGCGCHMVSFSPEEGYHVAQGDCACNECGAEIHIGDTAYCVPDTDDSLTWYCEEHKPTSK